jgi:bifunctional non-homologous end joining protein LigD
MPSRNRNGVSDFAALRRPIDREPHRLVLFVFDLLLCNGVDLRQSPLSERRHWLRALIPADPSSAIQFSDHFDGDGQAFFEKACAMGLEGIVPKQATT